MAKSAKPTPLNERAKKRIDAIIKAATDVFIENGYEKTNLDMIIARSGGSRATLYAHFGDKEGLLSAVIESLIDEIFYVEQLPAHENDVYELLSHFGTYFINKMLETNSIGLYRLIVAESANSPHLSQNFYLLGPQKVYHYLHKRLRTVIPELPDNELFEITLQFIEMLKSKLFFEKLYFTQISPSELDIEKQVTLCCDIIMAYIEKRIQQQLK